MIALEKGVNVLGRYVMDKCICFHGCHVRGKRDMCTMLVGTLSYLSMLML